VNPHELAGELSTIEPLSHRHPEDALPLAHYLLGTFELRRRTARLGYATTQDLLDELRARVEVDQVSGMPGGLAYRTVDGQ